MFSWRTLYRISNCSWVRIWMAIFIRDYWTSLNMNTIFRTYSRICNGTALTALIFWIWHRFVVILVRILLNIVKINRIPIGLCSRRSWTLHHHIRPMIYILRSVWRNSILYSHRWIMLVKNLLLADDNIIRCLPLFQNWLLLARIVSWMKGMNGTTALSWKLRSNLRRAEAIVLGALLLSEVLFYL